MTVILVALGAFFVGVGVTVAVARYFFLLGWEKAHDDRRLEPGAVVGTLPVPRPRPEETTGPIPAVGESSGRHAKPVWPDSEDGPEMDTSVFEPLRPEVRA